MVDLSRIAHRIVQHATKPEEPETLAQQNGRNGGLGRGKARAEKLRPVPRVSPKPIASRSPFLGSAHYLSISRSRPTTSLRRGGWPVTTRLHVP